MAMTQLALVFIGSLATLASMGMFVNFTDDDGQPDHATRLVVTFLAAVLWGVFGLSAFDVIVVDSYAAVVSEPIEPLAWTGIALSLLVFAFGFYDLVRVFMTRSSEASPELLS